MALVVGRRCWLALHILELAQREALVVARRHTLLAVVKHMLEKRLGDLFQRADTRKLRKFAPLQLEQNAIDSNIRIRGYKNANVRIASLVENA